MRTDFIQEITVVGDHDHGILKIDQELFQPRDGVQIQMVGRLVEEQDVRVAEQCLRQQDFHLLRAGQVFHHGIMVICLDTQSVKQRRRVGLGFPAVHIGEFRFQFAGADAVFVGEIFFGVDRLFFFHDLIQAFISHDDGIQNRIFVILEMILFQEGKTLSRSDDDFAAGGFQFAGQNLQERGLARAVGADQAVAVSFCKFDIDIFKQGFLAQTQSYVVCTYHRISSY